MPKPMEIELGFGKYGTRIPILYEDRSVMAIDKPAGWLLVPFNWQQTKRNLQAAISSSIAAGDFWAKSRNIKFLRNIHRLDGETSGILLMGKSMGALETFGDLFESRRMEKKYLAVVQGTPKQSEWSCEEPIGQDPSQIGRMKVNGKESKEAETSFKVLASSKGTTLIEARPVTGRTHQIRIHLLQAGLPIVGDDLYGSEDTRGLALRAIYLSYNDPFTKRRIHINAPAGAFLKTFGYPGVVVEPIRHKPEPKTSPAPKKQA